MAKEDFTRSLDQLVKTVSLFGLDAKSFRKQFVTLAALDSQIYANNSPRQRALINLQRNSTFPKVTKTLETVRTIVFSESYLSETLYQEALHKAYIGALSEAIESAEITDLSSERIIKEAELVGDNQRIRNNLIAYQAIMINDWAQEEYVFTF